MGETKHKQRAGGWLLEHGQVRALRRKYVAHPKAATDRSTMRPIAASLNSP